MAFKLRSGNRTSFKSMGSSPVKQQDSVVIDGKTYPKGYTKKDVEFLKKQREDVVRYEDLDAKGKAIWDKLREAGVDKVIPGKESTKKRSQMMKEGDEIQKFIDKNQKKSPAKQDKNADLKEWLMTERGFNQEDADRMIESGAYDKKDIKPGVKRKIVNAKKSTAKVKKGTKQEDWEPAYEGGDYSQKEIDAMTEEEKRTKITDYDSKLDKKRGQGDSITKKEKSPAKQKLHSRVVDKDGNKLYGRKRHGKLVVGEDKYQQKGAGNEGGLVKVLDYSNQRKSSEPKGKFKGISFETWSKSKKEKSPAKQIDATKRNYDKRAHEIAHKRMTESGRLYKDDKGVYRKTEEYKRKKREAQTKGKNK